MALSIGIIGLPNAGKSSLFKALTSIPIPIANYPFTTIEPNKGIVSVPDERLDKLAQLVNPNEITPTTIEFIDIAGLVKEAYKGLGLGNKFLSHIRETDAIIHLVRCFEAENVPHINLKINPKEDIKIIKTELILADLETLDKKINKIKNMSKSGDKEAHKNLILFLKVEEELKKGKLIYQLKFNEEEEKILKKTYLLTDKPFIYVVNLGEDKEDIAYLKTVYTFGQEDNISVIPIYVKLELELNELEKEEREIFIKEFNLEEKSLEKIIKISYQLLNLLTFFTMENKKLRAWTLLKGSSILKAAGKVHSEMEKGFICAEVIHFEELIKVNSILKAKEKGLFKIEGKDYLVKDGDIITFKFRVS